MTGSSQIAFQRDGTCRPVWRKMSQLSGLGGDMTYNAVEGGRRNPRKVAQGMPCYHETALLFVKPFGFCTGNCLAKHAYQIVKHAY
eukprot:scaffold2258_cov21-Tisochrysis_lutea.AAC.1